MLVKKEIETHNGLFRIGAVILNEDETWMDPSVKLICADNDFMLHFVPNGRNGTYVGKRHFRSLDEAEFYVHLLNFTGFSTMDL